MCMSVKTPKPPEPPASPPPPTAIAETVKPVDGTASKKKKRGATGLVLRRPTTGGIGSASSSATGISTANY